jgi:hypothetical protein
MDTATKALYVSVALPARSLAEVARYLYGSPEAAAQLQEANGPLPEKLPPGKPLRLTGGRLTEAAFRDSQQALASGTILRTAGLPSEGEGPVRVYYFTEAGQLFELTEGQFRGMLQGLSVFLIRKATYQRDLAQGGTVGLRRHVESTNLLIRGISNLFKRQSVPDETIWTVPETKAQQIITTLAGADFSTDLTRGALVIADNARQLQETERLVGDAFRTWHQYITGTIAGAEVAKDVTIGIAAGLAGALAASLVVAAAPALLAGAGGAGSAGAITGTTATILTGTAAVSEAALVGGYVRGTLEQATGGEFWPGFQRGLGEGALGGAGVLAAPGVAAGVSEKLFGKAPTALASFAERATVNVLTGGAIGVGAGTIGAASANLPVLVRGEITAGEYLSRIGWNAVLGGLLGGALGFVETALTRPPPTALAWPTPQPGGRAGVGEAVWEPAPPQVDTATGEITQLARHAPTGEIFQLRFNPTTGNGSLTRLATGETLPIVGGRLQPPPAGLLPPGPEGTPTAPESVATAEAEVGPQRIPGASDAEHRIDQLLRSEGHRVKPNPLEGLEGVGRQGDRLIDGVLTELKSLDPGATSNTIRNVVNNSVRRGGQARSIIIDARGSGLSQEEAARGIARAMGISRGRIDRIRVIGDGFNITN